MTRVKSHFRHLPTGQLVHIDEYSDKRKKAQAEPKAFAGKVAHADETSTSVSNHKGELKTYPHHEELGKPAIHAHLNKPLPVNADLAHSVVKHQLGIKDHSQFLTDAVQEESYKSKPRFQDSKGAADWFHQTHIQPKLKELRQAHGKTTTRAKAYLHKHPDLREMFQAHANDKDASAHEQAEGKMLGEHAEDAQTSAEEAMDQGAKAVGKGPKDAPKVPAMASDVRFFGHQAQALAQMNVLDASPVDVDMGGGKGLLLPADALALMGQGRVKRPLIVVPPATLDQNAAQITDKYTKGKVNVFKISSETIAKHHGGDITSVVEAIKNAPPNTIFMATYDAIAHQDREGAPERFPHAAALGAAGFDYLACDECHNVRNEDSARFQALTHLAGSKFKRMASGTFLANDPRDVVGPLKLLYPAMDLDQKKLEQFYGRKETGGEATWSPHGLKKLRQALLDLGMVSLRKSAWLDKLPKRKDALSVIQMLPKQKQVHEAVLHDALEQLEAEAKDNPLMAKALADDSLDNAWEAPPALMRKLEVLQGISDYPDEMARLIDGKLKLRDGSADPGADPEAMEAAAELEKFSPAARNAMLSLAGMVSPKALDVYAKAKQHIGDKKNGKFIVFCQRKAAGAHLMRNMPPELRQHAMYFDASKMDDLPSFTDSADGPKILIAVDASIKEGVNMQAANGMYRYDHHLTPGNQTQSYARIDRFGQDKPVSIHMGIMDGGMDVTKYARLCSKSWVNQQVVSDFESDKSVPIFKLSIKNLKEKRDASMLDDYQGLNDEITEWQRGENKKYKAKFGEQPYDLSSGKDLPGSKPASGGAYHGRKLKKAIELGMRLGFTEEQAEQFGADLGEELARRPPGWDLRELMRLTPALDAALKADGLWRYKQPNHVGSAHEEVGAKITDLPEAKLPRVQEIVQDAIANKDSEDRLARRLRASVNAGGGGDDRDWHQVARTEVCNARARGALDHIMDTYGRGSLVVRETNKCCPTCCNAFGKYVRRKWVASKVPDKYAGAVHPNCKCGPWKLVNPMKRLQMRKAMQTDLMPMGMVKRDHLELSPKVAWRYQISTGYGSWVSLDGVTGRTVMRAVLARCPLVVVEPGERMGWARVGHGRTKSGVVTLMDPALTRGARYYAMRDDSPGLSLSVKTREDYIGAMLQVLPVVVSMPEPWTSPNGVSVMPLTDFLGQKTLTDWWVSLPIGQPPEAVIAAEAWTFGSVRSLVRHWNKQLLNSDNMAKG